MDRDKQRAKAKFTFKTHAPTGRYRSFDTTYIDIKVLGETCGTLHEPSRTPGGRDNFSIRFMVEDESQHCGWRWITLKYEPKSFDDAKEYINTNKERIMRSFKLYFQPKD